MRKRLLIALFFGMLPLGHTADAQQLVKGMRCIDALFGSPIVHQNSSGGTRVLTIQIVKDRCRPRPPDGGFGLIVTGPGADSYLFGERYRGFTRSLTIPLQNNAVARVAFGAPIGTRISGTFDYTYTID